MVPVELFVNKTVRGALPNVGLPVKSAIGETAPAPITELVELPALHGRITKHRERRLPTDVNFAVSNRGESEFDRSTRPIAVTGLTAVVKFLGKVCRVKGMQNGGRPAAEIVGLKRPNDCVGRSIGRNTGSGAPVPKHVRHLAARSCAQQT